MELLRRTLPVVPERGRYPDEPCSKAVVHVADVLKPIRNSPSADVGKPWRASARRLGVPMLRGGRVDRRHIAWPRSDVRPFTDRQIELVYDFADQAVIAIENVRLFDEVQARTRELARRWSSRR